MRVKEIRQERESRHDAGVNMWAEMPHRMRLRHRLTVAQKPLVIRRSALIAPPADGVFSSAAGIEPSAEPTVVFAGKSGRAKPLVESLLGFG